MQFEVQFLRKLKCISKITKDIDLILMQKQFGKTFLLITFTEDDQSIEKPEKMQFFLIF